MKVPDHCGLGSRDGDRHRLTCGRLELDDVCAVFLRAVDHDPVLACGRYRGRSIIMKMRPVYRTDKESPREIVDALWGPSGRERS